MKFEFQSSWLRIAVELFRPLAPIRRYRVVPRHLDRETDRLLRRGIAGRLRQGEGEGAR